MALLAAVTLLVGFLCGCTSVGGVLLIPALDAWSDLGLRKVMGTVLLGFFFSGLVGLFMHCRAGRINFRTVLPLCAGALVCGYLGAVAKEHVSLPVLSAILGAIIALAGAATLRPMPAAADRGRAASRVRQDVELFLVGSVVAFLSGMTGAGGPVLSVPLMMLLGYVPLTAIAAALPLQVVLTFSGSVGNAMVGAIDYPMGVFVTVLMMLGVFAGTYSIRFFKPDVLKTLVSCLCIATGLYMLAGSLSG